MSHNTRARPSDRCPPCPDCETDVFVDHSKTALYDYVCHFCTTRWCA
jgi:hypothetical protein